MGSFTPSAVGVVRQRLERQARHLRRRQRRAGAHQRGQQFGFERLGEPLPGRLALARPQQLFAYGNPPPDLADLAASLAFAMARNHPFVDGNKRSAHVCYRVFLTINDAELVASEEEKYMRMLMLAEGSLSETEFAAWLRSCMRLHHGKRVQELQVRYR